MQIQNHCEMEKKNRNYCYLHFYFNTVFQRQNSGTEMTSVTAHNQGSKIPHEPQSALRLTVSL